MRRALLLLLAACFFHAVPFAARALAASGPPAGPLLAQRAAEDEESPERKRRKRPAEEEALPEALPLGVPAPRKEPPPSEKQPGPPPSPAPADAATAGVATTRPLPPPAPEEPRAAEGSSQLARPIEVPHETYADILERWNKRRALLMQHDPGAAKQEEDEIRRIRFDLAVDNLTPIAAALIRESERARAARAPAEAVARCALAVELAPSLPAAHLCLARSTLARNILDVAPALKSVAAAVGAALGDLRYRRGLLADAAVVLLGGLLVAGAVFLWVCVLRVGRLAFHDFHHVFPADATRRQSAVLFAILLASPILFGLGLSTLAAVLAVAAAFYLSRAEAVVVGLTLALLAALPHVAAGVAEATALGPRAQLVYRVEREGASDQAAAQLAERVKGEQARFEELFALARWNKRLGRYQVARELLERALAANPSSAAAQNNLGNVLFLSGDLVGAKAAFVSAAEREPTLAAAHYNVSKAYFREVKLGSGEVALQRAKELDPEGVAAFAALDTDAKANRFLMDVRLTDDQIASLDPPGAGARVRAQVEAELAGRLPPPAAAAAPLTALVLLLLAQVSQRRARPSRPCEKCGREVCVRCSPELGPSDVLCGQCLNVFVKKKSVDAAERIRKEVSVARHQAWKRRVALAASLFAGAGHVLGGQPVKGALLLLAAGVLTARAIFWEGVVRPPVPVTATASALRIGVWIAAALLATALSLRGTWKKAGEGEE